MKVRSSLSDRRSPRPPTSDDRRPPLLTARWQQEVLLALLLGAVLGLIFHDRLLGRAERGTAEVSARPEPAHAAPGVALAAGPWGRLRASALWLSAPRSTARPEDCQGKLWPWHFPGRRQSDVQAVLASAQLREATARDLLATLRCDAAGCDLLATAAQRQALTADERGRLYPLLAQVPENTIQFSPYRYRADQVQPWLSAVDLSSAQRAQVQQLLYRQGEVLVFGDQDTLCSQWPPEDQAALIRALSTTPTELVTLEVAEGQGVEQLAAYWGAGGREEQVMPLLTALARRPGGGATDISALLPGFMRQRLYHYSPRSVGYSCYHSALNAMAEVADDRFADDVQAMKELHEHYSVIAATEARRLGDVIAIEMPDGYVLHVMAYVAADIVFTKNGRFYQAPWQLARVRDVEALYLAGAYQEKIYRRDP